jgi:hypothetical protein
VAELGAFIERAGQDSSAARFAELIGRAMARAGTHISEDPRTLKPYRWPAPNISGGEYWDLASGPNAAEWMLAGLDEKTHYRLFDNHPFVIGFLDEVAAIGRKRGTLRADVSVESADVRHLKKPRRKLAAIRAKNVEVYVPGGTDAIEKMTDWIAEDGQLILQNNVDHRANDVRTIGPMIERLISKGWELRYLDPPSHDPRYNHISVYSLILTKPRADVPAADLLLRAAASRKVWDEFKSTSNRLSPADFMRRLIFG